MDQSKTLSFDKIKHTVTFNAQILSLNPLSFKLLEALANSTEEVLSVDELMSKVWQKTNVSPDTLKQRVFVLRKSIEEASIQGLTIQAVRGEGYRLIIEVPSQGGSQNDSQELTKQAMFNPTHIKSFKYVGVALMLLIVAVLISMTWFNVNKNKTYINNRVVLWANIPTHQMSKVATGIYKQWYEKLSSESATSRIQLVLSERQNDVLVPVQARRNRAGLISYFEVLETDKTTSIKLSIVEPRTATILRTNTIDIESKLNVEKLITSQIHGLLALISSEKLNLTKQQRESPSAPIWLELKAIANLN